MSDPVALLDPLVRHASDLASGGEADLAAWLGRELAMRGADEVLVESAARLQGPPAAFVAARFGRPRLLVNAHLDTVPANSGWRGDPLVPRLEGGRFIGLGACDTKGAVAALLAALDEAKPQDTMVLFSGDEEQGNAAMRAFLGRGLGRGLERAVVCEPTGLRVGSRHRGIVAFEARVTSEGGHSSRADQVRSPVGVLARLAVALDDWARGRRDEGPAGFEGLCLNLAKLDGGVAFNVIPASATLHASVRPAPGADLARLVDELRALARSAAPEAQVRFVLENAPFQTRDVGAFADLLGERTLAPVDLGFWTEAALLRAAGLDAVVFGPGDIAQAHAPDEWVAVDELSAAKELFVRMFRATVGGHGAG